MSLVPFRFAWPGLHSAWATIVARWEWGITSHANFIANTLLLVPFGFCGAGVWVERQAIRRAGVLLVLLCLGATSVASVAEVLQVFTPSRTPSAADVLAQTLGATFGIAGWLVLRREVYAWASHVTNRRSTDALLAALCGYGACYTIGQVLPLDVTVSLSNLAAKYRQGGIVLNPIAGIGRPDFVQSLVAQVAITTPLGAMLYLALGRVGIRARLVVTMAIGTAWAVALEGAQVLVMSRVADVWDVIAALAGGLVGAAASVTFAGSTAQTVVREQPRSSLSSWLPLVWVGLAASTYAAYNLSPFDFGRPQDVATRVSALFQVPFLAYYESLPLDALRGGVLKILLGVPLGAAAAYAVRRPALSWPRATSTLVLIVGVLFFTGIEAGQVMLPSRYPDNTDIILASCGLWLGLRAGTAMSRRH